MSELATASRLRDVLDAAARRLARAGVPQPRQEALALWAGLAGMSPGEAWIGQDRAVAPGSAQRFGSALERRLAGEPLAYVTRRAGFRTLELVVDRRVLIPRPETEGLVELVLQELAAWHQIAPSLRAGASGPAALDLGTGSGCIALSLAAEGRLGRLVATDCSAAALEVARHNAARLALPVEVDFRLGWWFEPVAGSVFDVIVSNPPYLAEPEYAALDPSVRDFEPREALVSGPDGLAATRAILEGAGPHLVPGGLLALELDSRRAAEVAAEARRLGWRAVRVERDLFGRPRYLLATRGSR